VQEGTQMFITYYWIRSCVW